MISTGIADQIDAPAFGRRVEQRIDEADQPRFHRRNRARRQCARDQFAHARMTRRIVENQTGRVMGVERRVAVLGLEFDGLVGAEGFRIAIDGLDVAKPCQKQRAIRHASNRFVGA